jgi:Ni/Co efflux regulator RcnB
MTSRSRIALILSSSALALGIVAAPMANAATTTPKAKTHKVAAKHKVKPHAKKAPAKAAS